MRPICALVLLLGLAIPVHGQKRAVIDRAYIYSGLTFDLTSTEIALRRGAKEGNPILGQSAARRIPLAVGLTVGADVLTLRMRKEHPKAAAVIRFAIGGAHVAVAGLNLSYRRKIEWRFNPPGPPFSSR